MKKSEIKGQLEPLIRGRQESSSNCKVWLMASAIPESSRCNYWFLLIKEDKIRSMGFKPLGIFIDKHRDNIISYYIHPDEQPCRKKTHSRPAKIEQRTRLRHQRLSRRRQPLPLDCLHWRPRRNGMGRGTILVKTWVHPVVPYQAPRCTLHDQDVPS